MRRAVITGLGAVTPVGNDVPTTWSNLVAARAASISSARSTRTASRCRSPPRSRTSIRRLAMSPPGGAQGQPRRALRRDRRGRGLRDASFEVTDPTRTGVILGSAAGGLPRVIEEQHVLEERGPERVSPHWLPNMLIDTSTSHIATMFGIRGVNHCIVSACASGTPLDRRGRRGDQARRCRRDRRRRHRVVDGAGDPGRLLRDAGAGRRAR